MADTSFPHTRVQALAMLYLQNQDISHLEPKELYDKYFKVCEELEQARKDHLPPQEKTHSSPTSIF